MLLVGPKDFKLIGVPVKGRRIAKVIYYLDNCLSEHFEATLYG